MRRIICSISLLLSAPLVCDAGNDPQQIKPNVVFILADDMGYGDVRVNNPKSKIPTPNLDKLASQGMNFSDAHSPSAVCTPTRYGVLTGRYCWRTRLTRGVLGGYSPPLIDSDRATVASMLKSQGYHTAAIGKWHLGMGMPGRDGKPVNSSWSGDGNVDFSKPIQNGPTSRGFDFYFGVSASLDMAPYVWIENDRFVKVPTSVYPGSKFPKFVRRGPQSADLKFDTALDVLAEKAGSYITSRAKEDKPFFLYLPLTGPHKPVWPHKRFIGRTKLGPYGDFVVNVDDAVGQVLEAIDKAGISEKTLVFYTSDNGSFMFRTDDVSKKDHVDDETKQLYRSDRHTANGPYRGTKADIWEAGHRVPFFVRWPGKIESGSTCDKTICHTDLFATLAEVTGATLGNDEAEDSFSILPLTAGKDWPTPRAPVVHHSVGGMFAIRDGKWKLVAGNGSGGREAPRGKPFGMPYLLFDLDADPRETTNVADQHSTVVKKLSARLDEIRKNARSVEREVPPK